MVYMQENQYLGSFPAVSSFDPKIITSEIDKKRRAFEDELGETKMEVRAVWILTDGILRVVLSAELGESRALLGFEAVARGLLSSKNKVDESELASLFIVDCLAGEDFPELLKSTKEGKIFWAHPILEIARPDTLDEVQDVPARYHIVEETDG